MGQASEKLAVLGYGWNLKQGYTSIQDPGSQIGNMDINRWEAGIFRRLAIIEEIKNLFKKIVTQMHNTDDAIGKMVTDAFASPSNFNQR